jgi:hypothetical protein
MHNLENGINMHLNTYENFFGFELVRIVSNDGLICPNFWPYALSNSYKQWTEDPISWRELVNAHKFDTSAVIIGFIKVVVPYYETKYFAIFLLKCQIFYEL